MKKLIKKINTLGLLTMASLAIVSCNPREGEGIGQDLCPGASFKFVESDLSIDGLTNNEVDLTAGGLHIHAKMDTVVSWELTISSDAATKTYKATSDTVDVRWFGDANEFPFFKKGSAKITFEIRCRDKVEKDFLITADPNFKNLHGSYGMVVRDWDGNGSAVTKSNDPGDPVTGEVGPGVDGYFYGNDANKEVQWFYKDEDPSPMGGKYIRFLGKSKDSNNPLWFFGGNGFAGGGFIAASLSTKNPDSLYFNFFARETAGEGAESTVSLVVSGESFSFTKEIDWKGWGFVSAKFSEFEGDNGKLTDLTGLNEIEIQMGASPDRSTSQGLEYDFLIITVGKPFFEEKEGSKILYGKEGV